MHPSFDDSRRLSDIGAPFAAAATQEKLRTEPTLLTVTGAEQQQILTNGTIGHNTRNTTRVPHILPPTHTHTDSHQPSYAVFLAPAERMSNHHLLDHTEERRGIGAGCESPTEATGLRRMSISQDAWCVPDDAWKVAPSMSYHLSPAVSAVTPVTPSASTAAAAAATNNNHPKPTFQTFTTFAPTPHPHAHSSLSSSPKAEYAVLPSSNGHTRTGSASIISPPTNNVGSSHDPNSNTSTSQSKLDLLVLQHQAAFERSVSAPTNDAFDDATTITHPRASDTTREPPINTHMQTPMVQAQHLLQHHHHAHQHYAPHQIPIQLLNHGAFQSTMSYHHASAAAAAAAASSTRPPPLSREDSLDREVLLDSARSESVSSCSSTTPSSRSSPLRFGTASASRERSRLGFSTNEPSRDGSKTVSKSNSQKDIHQMVEQHVSDASSCVVIEPDAAHEHPSSTPRNIVPAQQRGGAVNGGSALCAPDSTDSVTRTLSQNQPAAPGSVGSCASSTSSLGTLSGAVEAGITMGVTQPMPVPLRCDSCSSTQHSSPLHDGEVTPSTSSGSSLSAKERNARYKRSRATLEAGEEFVAVANTQLKTSASSAASSANGAQQAAANAAAMANSQMQAQITGSTAVEAPASATAAVATTSTTTITAPAPLTRSISAPPSQAAASVAPAPAASAAPVPTSLAPNTPKRQALISVLSCVLTQLFSNPNDRLPDSRYLTKFHTERLPAISIGKYLERIAHYSECSDEALVMAFIHISRISHNKPGFSLNSLSIHRLLLTAIMVTAKFFDDSYYANNFYSKVGGVHLREMNHLELDFLELIQFELYIDSKVYVRFYQELRNPVLHPNCTCMYQNMVDLNLDEIENPPQI